jgi:hypothetical protein
MNGWAAAKAAREEDREAINRANIEGAAAAKAREIAATEMGYIGAPTSRAARESTDASVAAPAPSLTFWKVVWAIITANIITGIVGAILYALVHG